MITTVAYYSALMNPPTLGKTELAANNNNIRPSTSFPLFLPEYNKHFTENEMKCVPYYMTVRVSTMCHVPPCRALHLYSV